MKQLFILVFLLLNYFYVHAQFNGTMHYFTQVVSTGSFNQTNNTNTELFNNQVVLGMKFKTFALNTNDNWVYGTQQNAQTNNDYNFILDCDIYKLFPHAYYWGLTSYTSSFSLKINKLLQAGAGIAYNVIGHKHFRFNVSDGVLYESNDIILPDYAELVYQTYRNSLRLMVKWDTGIVSVDGNFFYQSSFSSGTDYIIKANIAAGIKIKKWLTLTLAYIYNRFNRTERENTLFTYGLTLSRYYK